MDMDEELIANFVAVTDTSPERARQYLQVSDGQVDQAIDLFFSTGGADLGIPTAGVPAPPPVPTSTRPRPAAAAHEPINLDDDGDADMGVPEDVSDDEPQITSVRPRQEYVERGPARPAQTEEDDEAMARRLQEEMYSGGGGSDARNPEVLDADGYRAPIARTHETLVGPGEDFDPSNAAEMRAMVQEQMRLRQMARHSKPPTSPTRSPTGPD